MELKLYTFLSFKKSAKRHLARHCEMWNSLQLELDIATPTLNE
jgi:hypothetical protein